MNPDNALTALSYIFHHDRDRWRTSAHFLERMLVFALYAMFFWRTFKSNPGNRLVECGSLALIVFLVLIPLSSAGGPPNWLFGAWLILVIFLCFATLFFLFQRMFRALTRHSNQ